MKKKKLRWMKLDNSAKIYPAAKRRNWNNVFRVSASLCQTVDPIVLQSALETIMPRFPSIAVRLRRGLFWYYIEEIPKAPAVQKEYAYPLVRMTFSSIQKCAFRVVYYEERIAVELFHALTDGNGALIFLKTLVAEYLRQKHGVISSITDGVLDSQHAPTEAELEDSFLRYSGDYKMSRKDTTAYHLHGTKEVDFMHIVTGILSVDEVLTIAKRYNATLTELLAAVMIESVLQIQKKETGKQKKRKPVKVLIPVNLRRLFPSQTLRNFVLHITPGIEPRLGEYTFSEIVKVIHHQMGLEVTPKRMSMRIAANVKTEQNPFLKTAPLFLKNLVMKAGYDLFGENKACLTMSNLGSVTLPPEMKDYVSRMEVVLGMQATTPSNCALLSYDGKLYINFTRNIKEASLERLFFTTLRKLGASVKVESNAREKTSKEET